MSQLYIVFNDAFYAMNGCDMFIYAASSKLAWKYRFWMMRIIIQTFNLCTIFVTPPPTVPQTNISFTSSLVKLHNWRCHQLMISVCTVCTKAIQRSKCVHCDRSSTGLQADTCVSKINVANCYWHLLKCRNVNLCHHELERERRLHSPAHSHIKLLQPVGTGFKAYTHTRPHGWLLYIGYRLLSTQQHTAALNVTLKLRDNAGSNTYSKPLIWTFCLS